MAERLCSGTFEDGIDVRGFIEENELADVCGSYPYALIPSGTLDQKEDRPSVARFSLPSRMPFILAATNTPMIVLGSRGTAAARFVERLKVGIVANYDSSSFTKAVETVLSSDIQREFRQKAVEQAERFGARDVDGWIWRSLEIGEACDSRFESLMPRRESDLIPIVQPPAPRASGGIRPDISCNAPSQKHWTESRIRSRRWRVDRSVVRSSSADFCACPVHFGRSIDLEYVRRDASAETVINSKFESVEAAASNKEGHVVFQVSPDLYGSSLLHPADFRSYEQVEVSVTTIDSVANDRKIAGRGILKIDVQCAEHLVLQGAAALLPRVDVIVLELSLVRYAPEAKVFPRWSP